MGRQEDKQVNRLIGNWLKGITFILSYNKKHIQGVASRCERRQLTDCWPEGGMNPEGPATAQLDQGYPCFSSVGSQILRRTAFKLAVSTKILP